MSTLSHTLTQPHPGQKTADDLAALRSSAKGLVGFIRSVGRKGVRLILYILLLVPTLVLIILAVRKIKRATREINQAVQDLETFTEIAKDTLANGGNLYKTLGFDQMSPQAYARLKKNQHNWHQTEEKIKEIAKDLDIIDLQPLPNWLSFILSPFGNFYLAYRSYNERFVDIFRLFDESKKDGIYFKKIGEDELWRKRNKAYEYMI